MTNKKNHDYLLSDLTKLKGVGNKISDLLKKKRFIQFLICFGNYQNPILIEANLQISKI